MHPAQDEKQFYSVKDAAAQVGVSTHTLRLWETQGKIKPQRNEKGHRIYTAKEVKKLVRIQNKAPVQIDIQDFINKKTFQVTAATIVTFLLLVTTLEFTNATKKFLDGTTLFSRFLREQVRESETKEKKEYLANVLGERDKNSEFEYAINVPLRIGGAVEIGNSLSVQGSPGGETLGIATPALTLTGDAQIIGLSDIDAESKTTLEGELELGGDITGLLSSVILGTGVVDGTNLAETIEYEGAFNITGTLELDGDEITVTAEDINALDGGVVANKLDNIDSTQFLRSDTSDALTSGTLSFSAGTLLDLSAITYNSAVVQGIKLPQANSFTAPASGEGFLAYDADGDNLVIYNGSSWANASPDTSLQSAYTAGNTIAMTSTEGDINISNDESEILLFLDESTGYAGIGTTAPSAALEIKPAEGSTLAIRSAASNAGSILDVTNNDGSTSYMSIASDGTMTINGSTLTNAGILEAGDAIHLTDLTNTVVGTAVEGGWTLGSNNFTYRRRITVTNNDVSTALPTNYEVTVSLSSADSLQVYSNTQSDNDDFRIAYGSTEIARNVSSYASSSVVFTFQLDAAIAASSSDNTYYIYYSNEDLATSASTYTGNVQLDDADDYTAWISGDVEKYVVSQETTIKEEGTGSVQADASTGNFPTVATTSQSQYSTALSNQETIMQAIGDTNYLYTIGGESAGTAQTTVYKSTIDGSGNVGAHSTSSQGQLSQGLVQTEAVIVPETIESGDGSNGTLDLSLGNLSGGCLGTGITWDSGTSTCTLHSYPFMATGPTRETGTKGGGHTILRDDGKYMTIGGYLLTTSTIFDPATETFSAGPSAGGIGFSGHSFKLTNGDIITVRGYYNGNQTATYKYTAATDTYSTGPTLSAGAGGGTITFPRTDGKFVTVHAGNVTSTSIYDPATNTYSAGPSLTQAPHYGLSYLIRSDGKVLLMLGKYNSASTVTNLYDTATNTFTTGPALTAAAGYHSQTFERPDGKFIIIHGNASTSTSIYDPATNTMSSGPALTTAPTSSGYYGEDNFQLSDGRQFVVLGGSNKTNIYNPTTNTFTAGPNLNTNAHTATHIFEANNKGYVLFGNQYSEITAVDVYDPNNYDADFNFTTVNIPEGTTLTTSTYNADSDNPFPTLRATGNINVAGTVSLNGKGYAGIDDEPAPRADGNGPGGGESSDSNSCYAGGGGGGNGGAGGIGTGSLGGVAYTGDFPGSSGGVAPGSNYSGSGGGIIKIYSGGTVTISGTLSLNGEDADDSGGQPGAGGGAGGTLTLEAANSITVTGSITANGGAGEQSCNYTTNNYGGGGGGGGRIILKDSDGTVSGTITVNGGAGPGPATHDGNTGTNTKTAPVNNIYVLGGKNGSTAQTTVYKASLDSSGNIGTLATTSQTQLSEGRFGHSVHTKSINSTDYMYLLGGNNGTSDQTTVYKATVSSNNVGSWSTSGQGQLPVALSDHTSLLETISSSNYIYVIGGKNEGTPVNTVYKATIDSSGNIGTFSTTNQGQLPAAIYGTSAFIATVDSTRYLYVIGGHNGTSAVATTYRAVVDNSGDIGSFTSVAQDDLAAALYNHNAHVLTVGSTQYVYNFGGNTGSADVTSVYRGQLDPTDMTNYYSTKTLSSAVDFSNKNDLRFKVYGSVTGSGTLKYSEDSVTWQSCAFTVDSADTWETETCDITGVSTTDRDAVLYLRVDMSSYDTTQPYTFYFDDINVLMSAFSGTLPTTSNASAILGEADLTLNAQGTGAVLVNYDATNGEAGSGGFQVYNGGSTMLMNLDSSGNLGLGTTSPAYKLDVQGTFGATGAVTLTGLSTGTDNSVIVLNSSNQLVTDEIDSRVWGTTLLDSSTGTANYLPLFSDGDTLGLSSIYETGGQLGIGTTAPTDALHVVGGITAPHGETGSEAFGTQAEAAMWGTALGYDATATGTGSISIGNSSSAESEGIAIGYNATSYANRGIAIGYNAYSAAYSIAIGLGANAGSTEMVFGSTDTGGRYIQNVYFSGKTYSSPHDITLNGLGGSGTDITGGDLVIAGGKSTGSGNGGSIRFQTTSASGSGTSLNTLADRMTIDTDGNVGIGTTNPQSELEIYKASGPSLAFSDSGRISGGLFNKIFLASSGQIMTYRAGFNQHAGDAHVFQIDSGVEVLRIDGNSRVGIKDNAPDATLEVVKNSTDPLLMLSSAAGNDGDYLYVGNTGRVGIGTTGPQDYLSLGQTGGVAFQTTDTTFNSGIGAQISPSILGSGNAHLAFITNQGGSSSGERMRITNAGLIGIGTTNPGKILEVYTANAAIRINDDGTDYVDLQVETDGDFTVRPNSATQASNYAEYDGDSNWDFYSDERLKTGIEDVENILEKIMNLQVRRYNYTEGDNRDFKEIGLIAQEVEPYFPEIVGSGYHPAVGEDTKTLGYTTFGVLSLRGLQELKLEKDLEIEDLNSRVDTINELLGLTVADESSESSKPTESTPLAGISTMVEEMLQVYDEFKSFAESLGFTKTTDDEGNDLLAIESDLTVTGSATLADVKVTGTLTAGLIEIDTITNEINVLGASCFNNETGSHNKELCELQALNIQTEKSGNVNYFDGQIVLEPNGTLSLDKLVANKLEIDEDGETIGIGVIEAQNTSSKIESNTIKQNSKVFITPKDSTNNQVLYLGDIEEGEWFKVKIDEEVGSDIEFNWWIIN